MFRSKSSVEKQAETIRKKWRDYKVPSEARKTSFNIVQPFIQKSLTLIHSIGTKPYSKINRHEEEFTKLIGLLSRDCFLIGMEYGESKISDEVKELLIFISGPLIIFMKQVIEESISMGATPRQDKGGVTNATIEQIVSISKQCYVIGISHNPRYLTSIQDSDSVGTNQIQDKIRYLYSHVYLPNSLFEFPQKTYENLVSGKGMDYLLYIWNLIATKIAVMIHPDGLMMFREKIGSNHEAIIIQMPTPAVVPEAFFGAMIFELDYFTLSPKVTAVRYFTLEMGKNPYEQAIEYHFCEWSTSKEHVNYGRLSRCDKDLFL